MKSKIKLFFRLRKDKQSNYQGFTLIETIAGIAIFAILISGLLGAYSALSKSVKVAREKTVLSTLAANYLEIVRNLPYAQIGTQNGNPSGTLADQNTPIVNIIEGITYQIYYEVTYIDDPADGTILLATDTAPNDYKQIKMFIKNMSSNSITNFLTSISPQGLEGLTNAGALLIEVYDSTGQPINDADIHIENLLLAPNIILNRQTDSSGRLIEVALPASVNGYHITASKSGYSSDQTYPISVANPNPIKPDGTVVNGQVTQISLFIDIASNLTIRTLDQVCGGVSGVNVNVRGSKLIGTGPDVLKFDQNLTSSSGQIAMNNIEWDTYVPLLLTGQSTMVYGTSPIQQITVLPGANQIFTIILGPASTDSLLVIVKDAGTSAPLEGALVHLIKTGGSPEDFYGTTGGSVWVQSAWTGGSGQNDFTDSSRYFIDDGNIDNSTMPTALRLNQVAGNYVSSGVLESSSFDTGASSNFTTLTWEPTSQNPLTSVKFQLASNNDNTTWDFVGPDGTAGTYYTVSGTSLSSVHDNNQYMRYKVFLESQDQNFTPVLTSALINYVSGCYTPGQSMFPNLTAGNNYDLEVSLAGYSSQTINSLNINGNQLLEVLMSP
jgi:prepilin-type N-terminal cleavage/methylation domain-containing protein